MVDLSTTYLGIPLKNPLIVSSSGLTDSVEKICQLEKSGIGAVVLKSLTEYNTTDKTQSTSQTGISNHVSTTHLPTDNQVWEYIRLVHEVKEQSNIPVIASIHSMDPSKMQNYALALENAGVSAIEVNLFVYPQDKDFKSDDYEKVYYDVILKLSSVIKIPISMKLTNHFTNLLNIVDHLYYRGAKGVVLFNRLYEPDIDLDTLEIKPVNIYSRPEELYNLIRWIGLVRGQVEDIDIAASGGIHDAEGVIKMLVSGAKTCMICSTLYQHGNNRISEILDGLVKWMEIKKYSTIDEFRGLAGFSQIKDKEYNEKQQYLKYYANIKQ